ncbi:MAG: DNA/RNA non-specific endonuclease, partial [Bryobacteraceae bacterium]
MNSERRFAFYTACNIDGLNSINVRRTNDNWLLDPRIDESHQVGNELYFKNDLDRGHLVRRLDPVWGIDAERANNDTFFYTNASPQHARLNQGNWNALEDYVLNNTNAHDLRVNVYTGPIFADDDPEYRDVLLPQRFWKVVCVVNGDTGKLHATGYMLSQSDLLTDIEFVFGQFRTYQVPIAVVEAVAGLDFGKLESVDPVRSQKGFRERSRGCKISCFNRQHDPSEAAREPAFVRPFSLGLERTLRIPAEGGPYPLPPTFGPFSSSAAREAADIS